MATDLQKEIAAEEEKLAGIKKEQSDMLQANNGIQLEKEGLEASVKRIKSDLNELAEKKRIADADLDAASSARAGILSQLDKVQIDLRAAEADLQRTKTDNEQAKAAGEASLKTTEEAQAQLVINAQQKVDDLTAQKVALEKELAPLNDQMSRLTGSIAELNVKIQTLVDTIDKRTIQLEELDASVGVYNTTIEELKTKEDELAKSIEAKKAELASLDGEIQSKQDQIAELDTKIAASTEELKKTDLQNADNLKARAGVDAARTELEQRLDWLKLKYKDLDEPWG